MDLLLRGANQHSASPLENRMRRNEIELHHAYLLLVLCKHIVMTGHLVSRMASVQMEAGDVRLSARPENVELYLMVPV